MRASIAILLSVFALAALSTTAHADALYVYTGPAYTLVGNACPIGSNMEIEFTTNPPLPPNLEMNDITLVTTLETWKFSSCGVVCTNSSPCGTAVTLQFLIGTDAAGIPDGWVINHQFDDGGLEGTGIFHSGWSGVGASGGGQDYFDSLLAQGSVMDERGAWDVTDNGGGGGGPSVPAFGWLGRGMLLVLLSVYGTWTSRVTGNA